MMRVFDGRELKLRIISGLLLGIFALIIVFEGGWVFVVFISLLTLLASIEMYNLLEMKGESPYKLVGVVVSTSLPAFCYIAPYDFVFVVLSFSLIFIFFVQVISREYRGAIEKVLMTYFGIVYIGWLGGAHAVLLRYVDRDVNIENFARIEPGTFIFIFTVACTVAGDIGAYFVGKRFGKTKLVEKISPGKTVEGFLGGLVLSIATAILLKIIFNPAGGYIKYIILGLLCAFFGLLGDISESALKRDVHVKDSGFLIPGHGGILDRIDSLLFSIPVLYYTSKYFVF